jgi:hypothetical protein
MKTIRGTVWLLWIVLCMNVIAGIGILELAAAGFVGALSLFNMGGRFFWASTSDYIAANRPT